MVESIINLDIIFRALADTTRRDILNRVSKEEISISDLAKSYSMSFTAVAKHIGVLQKAGIVTKRRVGKQYLVAVDGKGMREAQTYLKKHEKIWVERFDRLNTLLNN